MFRTLCHRCLFCLLLLRGLIPSALAQDSPPIKRDPAGKVVDSTDILKKISIKRDVVSGQWSFLPNGKLLIEHSSNDQHLRPRLVVPGSLADEYEMTIVAERMDDRPPYQLNLIFPMGRSQVALAIDAFTEGVFWSALEAINGKESRDNETLRKGQRLLANEPSTIVLTVRRDHITVACNGKSVIDWKGDPTQLSVPSVWNAPKTNSLILGARASFLIHEWQLKPLSVASNNTKKAELPGEGELLYEGTLEPISFAMFSNNGEVNGAEMLGNIVATIDSNGMRSKISPAKGMSISADANTELDIAKFDKRIKITEIGGKIQGYLQQNSNLKISVIGKLDAKTQLVNARYILVEERKETSPPPKKKPVVKKLINLPSLIGMTANQVESLYGKPDKRKNTDLYALYVGYANGKVNKVGIKNHTETGNQSLRDALIMGGINPEGARLGKPVGKGSTKMPVIGVKGLPAGKKVYVEYNFEVVDIE